MLASCGAGARVEDNIIIDFEASGFAQLERDPLIAHFERLWWINIQEGSGAPWFEEPNFYIPNARGVLQPIVEQCHLGETIFQHQNHGMASLTIDDLEFDRDKVECVRRFERRGINLEMPFGIRALEELRSKGIMPPAND